MRKIKVQYWIISLLILFCCVFGFWWLRKNNEYENKVNKIIKDLMLQHQIPGAAIAIIDHDKTYFYTSGVSSKVNNTPVTTSTIFEVGSITKLFTALTSEVIINNRRELAEPLIRYFPNFNSNQYLRVITLEELLTYTSGLPFYLPKNITTMNHVEDYLLKWSTRDTIGSQWQYSNIGIGLVGFALEHRENQPISGLYKKYIFDPLNMKFTYFEVDKVYKCLLSQGYAENGAMVQNGEIGLFPAAGDLKSNIQDLSRFLALAIGVLNISPKLRQAMQDMQVPRLEVGNFQQGLIWQIHSLHNKNLLNEPEKMNLGPLPVIRLSEDKQVFDADKLMDKTGATEGFRAYIAVIPSRQKGIVILLNKYISNGAIVNAGRRIILDSNNL